MTKKTKKVNLNKHRQVKDSYYKNDNVISNSITYLCAIYPNNAELGAAIRKHFQKL